jgi:hypothetical protein
MRLFPAFPAEVVLGRGVGLADRAAGDAPGVGIAARLAFVGAGVDDEAGAARLEERIGTALERDERGAQRPLVGAVFADGDVREVAGVRPLRIEEAVLASIRIEVAAGGLEVAGGARELVDVDGVFPGLEAAEAKGDADAALVLGEERDAGEGSAGVLEFGDAAGLVVAGTADAVDETAAAREGRDGGEEHDVSHAGLDPRSGGM